MATDNFLTTKSVLGLSERVPMCPPETIVFSDSILWAGTSLTDGSYNQHQYAENLSSSNVTNYSLIG